MINKIATLQHENIIGILTGINTGFAEVMDAKHKHKQTQNKQIINIINIL